MAIEPEDDSKGLSAFSADVVRAAIVDAVSKALVAAVAALAGLLALLIWQGGSIPAWLAVLLIALAAAAAYVSRRQASNLKKLVAARDRWIRELETEAEKVPQLDEDVRRFSWGLERHETYSEHIAKVLDHLQRVVTGDIGVPIPHYIERGILQPARDLLMKDPGEEVRLSVLMPANDRWTMVFGAGHSVPGQTKYNEKIANTLSRLPLESGEVYVWEDVVEDDRFRPNPKASREIHAMISLPLWSGDEIVGVLNVVASVPDAFDAAELAYVRSLASVVSVAMSVHLQKVRIEADNDS